MAKVSELMSNSIEWMKKNKQTWSIFYNMLEWGAKGDGVADDKGTLDKIIQELDGRNGMIIFPAGTYNIGSNLVIPENVYLFFVGEGLLSPASGVTITLNGGIIAGPFPIFTGEGTFNGKPQVEHGYSEWFGAKGDAITDDTRAISRTVSLFNNSTILFFNKTYKVTLASLLNPLNSTVYQAEGTLSRFLYNNMYYPIPVHTALLSNGDDKVVVSIGGNVKTIELKGNDLINMRDEFSTFDARLDTLIQGGGPDKDLELVDIRTPVMGYVPDDTIHAAGDMTRDMQSRTLKNESKLDNPLAGRARIVKQDDKYNAWSNIVRTHTNRIIVVYNHRNQHKMGSDIGYGKICYKYSDNAGLLWSEERVMIEHPNFDFFTASLGVGGDGSITCIVRRNDLTTVTALVLHSTDDGETFTTGSILNDSTDVNVASSSVPNKSIYMDNGKMMILSSNFKSGLYGLYAIFSDDNGKTWTSSVEIIPNIHSSTNAIPTEIRPVYLGNGKVIAVGRNQLGNLYQLTSKDYGMSWVVELTNIDDCYQNCADLVYVSVSDTLSVYYTDRNSNTLLRRSVMATRVFNNPTGWPNSVVLDYTSGPETKIDAGYTSTCLLRENSYDVITTFYTTRDIKVEDDTTPRKTAVVVTFDKTPKSDEYKNLDGKYRQALINGGFSLWDYGDLFNSTGLTANRWRFALGSGTLATITKQPFNKGQSQVPGNPKNFMQIAISSLGSATSYLGQRIESSESFAGEPITYSFYARAANGNYNLGVYARQFFGSGGSSAISTSTQNHVLTSKWKKFKGTIILPNVEGKTIGTGDFLELSLSFVIAQGINTIQIAQFQQNAGFEDLPFFNREESLERLLSERFAIVYTSSAGLNPIGMGVGISTTQARIHLTLPTTMRTLPSLSATASDWRLTDGVNNHDVTALSILSSSLSDKTITLIATVVSGLEQFRPYQLIADGTINRILTLSAEY